MFHPNLFFKGKIKNKKEIIEIMCNLINKNYNLDDNLFESVMKREEMGYTSFNNKIAITHPKDIMSDVPIGCLAILEEEILWDNKNVQIIILFCNSKSQEYTESIKELFKRISILINSKEKVDEILSEMSYMSFINVIKNTIS